MDDMEPWHFVFAEERMLAAVGVESATPVSYDPSRGVIEILDDGTGCNQWVVRTTGDDHSWIERLAKRFGILPIYMEGNAVEDFSSEYVKINTAEQLKLFTSQMGCDFEVLMNTVRLRH